MNSGLVLLLVAALYTSGCVNAVDITVEDAVTAAGNYTFYLIETYKKPTLQWNLKVEIMLL